MACIKSEWAVHADIRNGMHPGRAACDVPAVVVARFACSQKAGTCTGWDADCQGFV